MKKYLDIIYFNRKEIIIVIIMLFGFFSFNYFNKNDSYIVESEIEEKKDIKESIVIDIKGEVNNPGSYEIENDKRIKDAITKAGGLTNDADTESINLSEKLQDEMLIVIPKKEEIKENNTNTEIKTTAEVKDNKISINTATKQELMKISGIGESKAQSIIDYRNQNGRFNKLEELTNVSGIGKKTFEKIKNSIKL